MSVVEALLWLAAALTTRRRLIALQVVVVALRRVWEALPDHGDVVLAPWWVCMCIVCAGEGQG